MVVLGRMGVRRYDLWAVAGRDVRVWMGCKRDVGQLLKLRIFVRVFGWTVWHIARHLFVGRQFSARLHRARFDSMG